MRLFAAMAWRSLGRRPMRTFLTMSAMAGATAVLITALGLLVGMLWDTFAAATENYRGHAVVAARRYLDERRVQLSLGEADRPAAVLDDPAVAGRTRRVRGFVLLSAGREEESQSQPAELLGVEPAGEAAVSRLPARVAQGRFLSGGRGELVLGAGLARRLKAGLGAEVAAMGAAADGSIAAGRFTVVGILDSGDRLRDSTLALTGLGDLQELLALDGRIHEWVLRLKEPLRAKDWAARAAPKAPSVEVAPWSRFLPQLSEMLDMIGVFRAIYAGVFYFAVVLVAANTMTMALLERVREFAVMGALGLKPLRLALLVGLEALFMSLGAALAGGGLGALSTWLLERHPLDFRGSVGSFTWAGSTIQPVYRAEFSWGNILFPVAVTAVLGLIVALFPAWKLCRTRPADVLREV